MCGAVATFSCLDTTGKYLIGYMDPLQVVWARYFGAFLLALVFLNPVNTPGMMVTRRPWLQIGRSALLLLSTALNFFALRYLQLDEALSILFATPFIVAIMSGGTPCRRSRPCDTNRRSAPPRYRPQEIQAAPA